MKTGDSVKVKQGILDPDYNQFDMSGWQGRVISMDEHDGKELIEIQWDSITLKQLPAEFIESCVDDGCEYSVMWLADSDVEPAMPRDTESEVSSQLDKLENQFGSGGYHDEENRIAKLLQDDDLSVNEKNQQIFYSHLLKNLRKPVVLTGMQDFPWEEKYLFGGWSKKEYHELKKTQPSYTDRFEFIELSEEISEDYGICAHVKRLSDKKRFTLPLWDLECVDPKSKNAEMISDYSFWMTNYQ